MFSPGFHLHQSSDLSKKDFFSILQQIGKPISVKKGQMIIRNGSFPSFFFFVRSGIFKTSTIVNGKEFVLGFTFEGDVDGCPVSLLFQQPNNFSIESVTDGTILICELSDFYDYCKADQYHSLVQTILIHYLHILEKRVIEAISLTAAQRYKLLIEQQPDQVNQIPLTYIAAYLGISLESLSRVRKKMKV